MSIVLHDSLTFIKPLFCSCRRAVHKAPAEVGAQSSLYHKDRHRGVILNLYRLNVFVNLKIDTTNYNKEKI